MTQCLTSWLVIPLTSQLVREHATSFERLRQSENNFKLGVSRVVFENGIKAAKPYHILLENTLIPHLSNRFYTQFCYLHYGLSVTFWAKPNPYDFLIFLFCLFAFATEVCCKAMHPALNAKCNPECLGTAQHRVSQKWFILPFTSATPTDNQACLEHGD